MTHYRVDHSLHKKSNDAGQAGMNIDTILKICVFFIGIITRFLINVFNGLKDPI